MRTVPSSPGAKPASGVGSWHLQLTEETDECQANHHMSIVVPGKLADFCGPPIVDVGRYPV